MTTSETHHDTHHEPHGWLAARPMGAYLPLEAPTGSHGQDASPAGGSTPHPDCACCGAPAVLATLADREGQFSVSWCPTCWQALQDVRAEHQGWAVRGAPHKLDDAWEREHALVMWPLDSLWGSQASPVPPGLLGGSDASTSTTRPRKRRGTSGTAFHKRSKPAAAAKSAAQRKEVSA